MKIAFNPSTVAALTTPPNNKDITFDLRGRNIFARGVKFYGTDTNTWRDIKVNNVSIGSHTLDLRNGSNTTLTNTNGVVTINSTWRPVVDNLTSDSTTSSLSAKQGKVLKGLIDSKSNSGHTHDDRYLKLTGGTMTGNIILSSNVKIIKPLVSTSNYSAAVSWSVDGETKQYGREIGLHNTGGNDSTGSIAIVPYKTSTDPWSGTVGLFIAKNTLKLDGKPIALKSDLPSSLKNPYSLTLLANGTTLATYDGSVSKIVNLTYDNVGAAAKNHTHNSLEPWASYINGDSHAAALKSVFNKNKTSIPRNKFISMLSSAYGNGSYYMGYFLYGYENNPYGGFFVAHYDAAYYIGISNGSFSQHRLVYSTDIPSSLKNPHALTISLNGTSQGPYDGSAAKNINITPSSIGAATSGHNHDDRYLKLTGGIMQLGEGLKFHADNNYFGTNADARIISLLDGNDKICDGGLIIDERGTLNGKEYVTELLRIRDSEFKWRGSNILHSGNSYINGSTIKINNNSITVYSSGTADERYVKKSGDTMSGVLTIDTTNFGALTIKRNDDVNGASIQFRGKSNVYGYIGLNSSAKDKLFLRWTSNLSVLYTILDTSSTYTSNGKGVINGTTITQVDNATNADTVDGVHVIWGGSITNTNWLAAWENYKTIRCISPAHVTVGNSDKVDGYHATSGNNKPWGTIPAITPNGYMDIGKHLEFHYDNSTGSDYSTALMCLGNYSNIVYLPSASGTLALTSQVLTWKSLIIDMRNYSGSYWHPVTVPLPYTGYNKIKVSVLLNSGDKPSWAEHPSGITCNMEIWATASGWGTTNSETICLNYTYKQCSLNPCGWMLLGYPSLGVLFLRGGSRYRVYTDFDATFTPHDLKYTWTSGSYSLNTGGPYTSCPGLNFNKNKIYANLDGYASRLEGGSIPGWGTLTAANGFTNVSSYDYGSNGAYGLCGKNSALYMLLDGYFYQNEGRYRVLDTSDISSIRGSLTLSLYLSSTDTSWYPLVWGGDSHRNTNNSTGSLYKSYDKLSWLTSSLTLYATKLRTTNLDTLTAIFHPGNDSTLKIYSGKTLDAVSDGHIGLQTSIDNTDGQTHVYPTLHGSRCVLALLPRGGSVYIGNMPNGGNGRKLNVNGDIGLFNTGSIRDLAIGGGIYWNPYVESATDGSDAASITLVKSGVAGGTTLVLSLMNDANDTILFKTSTAAKLYHNSYPILTTLNTYVNNRKGYIYGTEITLVNNSDTVDGYHATDGRTFTGNINWSPNWSDVWSDGTNTHPWYGFDHRYPNTGAYSTTITDYFGMTIKTAKTLRLDCKDLLINGTNISNLNVASASKLQTARKIWGQSFDGTADISGTLSGVANILFSANNAYDIGSNSNASRYIYTHWLGSKSGANLRLAANNSDDLIVLHTNGNVGIGTNTPGYKLQVNGDQYTTGWSRANNGFYCENTGVHFTHNGSVGEIAITSNNEFTWGSSTSVLYFNYRKVSRGNTVTNYIWNAGSSTSWAKHSLGALDLHGNVYWTNGDATMKIYGVDTCCGKENIAFLSTFDGQDPLTSSYVTEYRSRSAILLLPRGGNVGINVSHDPSYSLTVGGDIYSSGYVRASNGFIKGGSSNAYVLLGGGSHKAESSLNVANSDTTDGVHINWSGTNDNPTYLASWDNNGKAIRAATRANITVGNSDKLDGYHENSFLRYRGATNKDLEATLWSLIGIKEYQKALPDSLTSVYNFGSVISLPGLYSRFEIYASHLSSTGNGLYYRSGWTNDKQPWRKFIDSSNIGSQSVNYANSAGSASSADKTRALKYTGTGSSEITAHLTDASYMGRSGWASYIICNHGNGSTYYSLTIAFPFWGSPIYRRLEGGTDKGWKKFYTEENPPSWNNVTNKPSSFTPSSHTHTWTSITDKIVAGNEFNIVNAGFNNRMWFNYLPINDRSKTATITSYHFGNGSKGYASVTASGFVKNGSSSSYVLLGDGGHKTISSLSVNYANSAGSVAWSNVSGRPSSLKNPYSLNVFGVAYDGSAAKTVTTSTFIGLVSEATATITDGTMFITSWASDNGFADTNAVNVPYKRKAVHLWEYIKAKTDTLYSSKSHTHSYLPLAGGTMDANARISHGDGNLYIGRADNNGWVYTQNIASHAGTDKWNIKTSGAAQFGIIHIASKADGGFNSSVIECNSTINLNYYSSLNVSLCNGGGNVGIGIAYPGSYKLNVNGSARMKSIALLAKDELYYKLPICIACGYVYDGPDYASGRRTLQISCNRNAQVALLDSNGKYRVWFTDILESKYNREKMSLLVTGCPGGLDTSGTVKAAGMTGNYGSYLAINVWTSDDASINPSSFYFALWSFED